MAPGKVSKGVGSVSLITASQPPLWQELFRVPKVVRTVRHAVPHTYHNWTLWNFISSNHSISLKKNFHLKRHVLYKPEGVCWFRRTQDTFSDFQSGKPSDTSSCSKPSRSSFPSDQPECRSPHRASPVSPDWQQGGVRGRLQWMQLNQSQPS